MTPCIRRTTIITLILCMALPAWGQQYYLYAPHPVASDQKNDSQDGVLVKEIEVQRGDTLFGLSRKYSGHGMYFPQILLFNSIKNPNLIYPGKSLKVPVVQKEAHDADMTDAKPTGAPRKVRTAVDKNQVEQSPLNQPSGASPAVAPGSELSVSDLKTAGAAKTGTRRHKKKSAGHRKNRPSQVALTPTSTLPAVHKNPSPAPVQTPTSNGTAAGQKLFEAATKAYRQDDCRTALELLDRYLLDNSGSPLAADANLYKAECYLKMSAQ